MTTRDDLTDVIEEAFSATMGGSAHEREEHLASLVLSLRAQLAAAEGQARGSEAMLIQAQRDCDNAQNAELVALSQLAEMTKERDEVKLKGDELRREVAKFIGADPESWPLHGNWPLAIMAHICLEDLKRKDLERLLAERDAQVGNIKAVEDLVASEPLTYQVSGICDNDGTVRWILHTWGVSGNIEAPSLAVLGAALATGPRATEET